MANEVTWSNLQGEYSYEYRLLADSIITALYESLDMRQFSIVKQIKNWASNAERFPKTPTLVASGLTEGTDLVTNTAFAPTQVTLTVGEVGLKLTVTDLMAMGGIVGIAHYGQEAGKAVAEKRTTDLVALMSGFSNSVGTTNTDITEAFYLAAIAQLRGAKVKRPYVGVLHTTSYYSELIGSIGSTFSALANTGAGVRAESNDLPGAGDGGMVGELYGTTVLITPLVGEDGNSDKINGMYNPNRAIGYVEKWAIRPEMERKPSLRGSEVVVTAAYAVGETDDISGVRIVSDGV
ncbi:hypothetical protein LCGC14_1375660 [marine sediment metagenome]|uniref:Uncharacterized protein n=1 Tax=marine sediment metagenome TaxID=412755 RepID=A0A0F9MJE3_9ZZZZ